MDPWGAFITILISAAPVLELRGGIPFALARGFTPAGALGLALLGNLVVVPILLWGLAWGERFLMRFRWSRNVLNHVLARSRRKSVWVERLGALGLVLLVAVPFPGTGAWTGALVSRLLGLSNWRALLWIVIGVLISSALVLAASLGLISVFGLGRAP